MKKETEQMLTVVISGVEYKELKRLARHGEISGILRDGMKRWINNKKRELAILEAIEKNPQLKAEIEAALNESESKGAQIS